ncbi:acyltransferase family protein [Aeromonas caviae]|jgi:peptidoglycan/LPS O-acetylase OafA/YrhL|uniref:Acyltransferase n=3 Tax=Aeromonas TaxID=642 RepID=A0ABX6NPE2_AERME|nr:MULTISPECIES: acyltransferase [Aeromonas]MBS4709772.1 acyltransferase [Aeromonas caviae]MDX7708493.1 acyltransferase [Aeromonas caviae]MDX7719858.1 acyltransferase [Aeromonas caviae]MDX7767639.1 acyltransferase [Aeromonas caviae]MDX7821976.1 acyltransferase [Aeromonas caviae]
MNKREIHLDVIRIVACLAVILFHYNVYLLYADPKVARIGEISYLHQTVGDIAISLFIILSGFALTISQGKVTDNFSYLDFYKRRFLGIYPSFWISYLIVAAVFLLVGQSFGDGQWWKLLLSLIGLDGFFLYRMQNYYLVGEWYTGYMLITYLLYPFLKKLFDKTPLYCWLIVLAIFISLNAVYDKLFDVYINCNPIMRMPEILFGITFATYIINNRSNEIWLSIISLFVLVFSSYLYNVLPPQLYMLVIGVSIFSIMSLLFSFIRYNDIVSNFIVKISSLTFLAFLFHHQIIYAVFRIFDYRSLDYQQKVALLVFCVLASFYVAKEVAPLVNSFTRLLKSKMLKNS